MDNEKIKIKGGKRLEGKVPIQGSKNAILPMIAASLLVEKGKMVLRNVPAINDVFASVEILKSLGARVDYNSKENTLTIDSSTLNNHKLDCKLTSMLRASILFIPPVLIRLKKVNFNGAGGCNIGTRALDYHYNGFKKMGAEIEGENDRLLIKAEKLYGNILYLDTPSQTGTENLMMCGVFADGITVIENAANEPEVVDFANFLNKMGAKIHGAGSKRMTIEGVKRLNAVEYSVSNDRLDAGTFMMAGAITGGDLLLEGVDLDFMRILTMKLEQMRTTIIDQGKTLRIKGPQRLKPVNIITWTYPGFSTDYLPCMLALACVSNGKSYFRENIFSNRFTNVKGLNSLGADIKIESNNAIVSGVDNLKSGQLHAPDLRSGMSYILAGLFAGGEIEIGNAYQICRGYSDITGRLKGIGAMIN